ncbi:hypothetical protein [Hymenobacter cellulosilyticus]|uniref:Lipoprotein n=1 Tax=Hymenobacter cellulosilyticus TaxID=2932248 RepID=A0A8T9Q7T6_9BACT|nr:hypothetical protein [Hymenobacter cellulosilyticus]UOQ73205.1 hypothetical protein MUN79_04330 [Hymenobacter cellulosilyticus]
MKFTITRSLFLGLTLLLTTGCDKEDDQQVAPEPLPEPTFVYSRSIVYYDNGQRRDTTFQDKKASMVSVQNSKIMRVAAGPLTSTEYVDFTFDRTAVKSGIVGSYTLKTQKEFAKGDADLTYAYRLPENLGGGSVLFNSRGQNITGNFIITAYDAKRQLLSGTYTATLAGNYDPTVEYSSFPKRRCDIIINGSFTNVPLKTEE